MVQLRPAVTLLARAMPETLSRCRHIRFRCSSSRTRGAVQWIDDGSTSCSGRLSRTLRRLPLLPRRRRRC